MNAYDQIGYSPYQLLSRIPERSTACPYARTLGVLGFVNHALENDPPNAAVGTIRPNCPWGLERGRIIADVQKQPDVLRSLGLGNPLEIT